MTESCLNDISEWICAFVDAGHDFGAMPTLHDCMERGDEDGDIRVPDQGGIAQRFGTQVYENAFLVTLHKLVVAGRMELAFETPDQQNAYRTWITNDPRDAAARKIIQSVPLRYLKINDYEA